MRNGDRLAAAALIAATLALSCSGKRPLGKPNVILIVVDSLRADRLGCYGYSRATSPRIDSLAAEGARFERVSCQAPRDGPSVASILTGLYPSTHGVTEIPSQDAGAPWLVSRLSEKVTTLAEALQAAGYRTGAFVSNPALGPERGLDAGFADFRVFSQRSLAEEVNREALAWIQGSPATPFFLYVHYTDVNAPYDPPAPYDGAFKPGSARPLAEGVSIPASVRFGDCRDLAVYEARYDGALRYCDEEIGEFMKRLRSAGLAERTLVVLTSDHGEEIYEHEGFGHGRTVYEEVLHVPVILRLPGSVPAGRVVSTRARSIDIYPTILSLCDVALGHAIHGRTLTGMLDGSDSAEREVFAEAPSPGAGRLCRMLDSVKSIYSIEASEVSEYLLLEEDPTEKSNAIGRLKPAERRALAKQFQDYQRQRAIEAETWASSERRRLEPAAVERLKALGYFPGE